METIETSAPGKVFLLGEYAVLDGAPALLSAVDRRARVRIRPSGSERWRIGAPAIGIERMLLDERGVAPAEAPERAQLLLFDAVRDTVLDRAGRSPEPLDVFIDSSPFTRDGHKLGLGSSAAVAVALTAALAQAAGLTPDAGEVFAMAVSAHRIAQNGAGSGGDVATSVYGGLLEYTDGARPTQLDWPDGLAVSVVLTGSGASTTDLVSAVAAYAQRDTARYRDDMARLARLAEQARPALHDPDRLLRLAADYFAALGALGEHSGAGIVTERHHVLRTVAARNGGVFKTSGAGGGDVGLVFSRAAASEAIRVAMEKAGAGIVPLDFGAVGLQYGGIS